MLTPIEVQSKIFKNSGMGYSKADVDSFFSTLAADYQAVFTENAALKEKIASLDESLSRYREIERSLQKALVLAETTAEETVLSAKKNATVIEQEAVLKAQTIVADAKVDLEKIKVRTADLLKQYESYKAQYKAFAQSQLDMLNSDSFNIGPAIQEDFANLEKTASVNANILQAGPVNVGNTEEETKAKAEEEFDETLFTEDEESIIKDFSEMFTKEEN